MDRLRRISGFHLLNERDGVRRVSVRIMLDGVGIVLPVTIAFVANLPVTETAMVGLIGVPHPRSGLSRGAAAVIDGCEHLRPQICGYGLERCIPARVTGPMIGIGG